MSVEARRVCGYRQIGGIYLVGEGSSAPCAWLPHELTGCALCDFSPPFTRGVQRVSPRYLFNDEAGAEMTSGRPPRACDPAICRRCPIPRLAEQPAPAFDNRPPLAMLWVGRQYTTETFTREALELGVSRRISNPPDWLTVPSWIFCAHLDGAGDDRPAVFYVFKLTRIEIMRGDKSTTPAHLEEDRKRGWTTVQLPESDPDHNPGAPTIHKPSWSC